MESADNMNSRVASFACYLDTAKENLVHRVLAQEATPILLSSAKTKSPSAKPPFNISFSHSKEAQDGLTNLPFSYPNTAGENFAFEVPGPIQDPTSAFSFSNHEIPKDGEISVFGADKYFNMKLEYHDTGIIRSHELKNERPLRGSNIRPRTPSVCSEESSMNSQTALLPSLKRMGSLSCQKRAFGRSIFGGFGCQGPCFDKKAVIINEIVPCFGSKPTRTGSERIDQLALLPMVKKQLEVTNIEDSRHSIEVFGSSTVLKGDIAAKMERKLSMLTWDAIPKGQNLPTSTVGSGTICDDMASDASSDLFEIEQVSGSLYPARATDDASSCLSPQSHYAPSEASIQWSVVTASAADYSAFSDYNDDSSVSVAGQFFSKNNTSPKTRQTGRAGGLLGCKSFKSVDVADEKVCHKANEKVNKHTSFGKSQGTIVGRLQSIHVIPPNLQRSFANGIGGL